VKKIIIVENATAYTWDWYCHLVVDRASFEYIRKLLFKSQLPSDVELECKTSFKLARLKKTIIFLFSKTC